MYFTSFTPLVLAATTVSATRLFASSYAGTITTLDLSKVGNATYYLAKLDINDGCSPNGSWIEIDVKRRNLFCLDEGMVIGNGSLTSFKIKNDDTGKTLTQVQHAIMPSSRTHRSTLPSSTAPTVDPITASYSALQHFNFTTTKPGPNAARQAASHPHQVLIDPTKQYLVVPDLGADIIRVFYIDPKTLNITPRPSINVPPGSGPRHGVFYASKRARASRGEYDYYLVSELSSTLAAYSVSYLPNTGGITMTPLGSGKTYGSSNDTIFSGNAPAEIALAPPLAGGDVPLIVSNRNATFFKGIANPDPNNVTKINTDTIASFSISNLTDSRKSLQFPALSPAGGSFPRHFSLNRKGNLVAVGLQNSGRVVIYERCTQTGKIDGRVVADIEGLGAVTSVVWDESEDKEKGMKAPPSLPTPAPTGATPIVTIM